MQLQVIRSAAAGPLALLVAFVLWPAAESGAQPTELRSQPAAGATPISVPVGIASARGGIEDAQAAVDSLMRAFTEEDIEGIMDLLPQAEIPFELDGPAEGFASEDGIRRSREQIFYLLQDFFEKEEPTEVGFDEAEDDTPDDLHGVLRLELEDSPARRLFLHLHRMKGHWKVAELRVLP